LRGAGVAINIAGSGNQVLLSEVHGSTAGGILVSGDNFIARSNTITQVSDFGIVVQGNGAQLQFNRVAHVGAGSTLSFYLGVEVPGNQAFVSGNVIENIGLNGTQSHGLIVTGVNPTVQANRLTWAGEAAITCTTCTGGKAFLNALAGSTARGFV